MAITKQSNNMKIKVRFDYNMVVEQKAMKIADRMNIEARRNNLFLISNKKVVGQGGKSS